MEVFLSQEFEYEQPGHLGVIRKNGLVSMVWRQDIQQFYTILFNENDLRRNHGIDITQEDLDLALATIRRAKHYNLDGWLTFWYISYGSFAVSIIVTLIVYLPILRDNLTNILWTSPIYIGVAILAYIVTVFANIRYYQCISDMRAAEFKDLLASLQAFYEKRGFNIKATDRSWSLTVFKVEVRKI